MAKEAKVTIHPSYKISKIDERLYGSFLEPIGNWVLGGIWNPNHSNADDMGFRKDMLGAVKELGIPAIRLPGGNFMSGWNWKDSIGPREQRKAHLDLAWRQIEPNIIGHDEYLEWARRAGVETMYTINLGTADINSAIECIEYTNHPGGTYWSDLRRQNGYEQPHKVKTWYLGNEPDGPWQINSWEKRPVDYGITAHEVSKAMKWVDPSIETVVGAASSPLNRTYPQWELDVLEQCYETVDMISLHFYHRVPLNNYAELFAGSVKFEEFINTEIAVCDFVQAKLRNPRKMMISFDEYACTFSSKQPKHVYGRAGHIPHDVFLEFSEAHMSQPFRINNPDKIPVKAMKNNEMIGALTSGSVLLTFLRHADRIKMGCMTTGIGGAIAYDRDHVWPTATYYTYASLIKYGRGISLLPVVEGPTFNSEGFNIDENDTATPYENVPYVESAAAYDVDKGELNVFIVNRNWEENVPTELDVRGFEGYDLIEHIALYSDNPNEYNSYDHQAIVPKTGDAHADSGKVSFTSKKLSWNVLRFKKKT
jgi:alpha-N-arabinofuranosidase